MTSPRLTDALRETLALFEETSAPMTTTEVAEQLDLGRRSTYERLNRLVEHDRIESKKVGANARVWWLPQANSDSPAIGWSAGTEPLVDDILDDVDVGVVILDEWQRIAWLNESMERYFDLDRSRVLGRDQRAVIEERIADKLADGEAFKETLLATYENNTDTEQFECRITPGEDRQERWLEHRSKPIDSGAYAGGRIELYYDVNEQNHPSESHDASEGEFTSMVDAVEEYAIFMLDPDGYVKTWNSGAEQIKGYETHGIVGEHFSTFYTETDCEEGVPRHNLRKAASDGSVEDEGWRVRKDGSRFWANVTITAVRDSAGELQGYIKVTRDTTEQRHAAAKRELLYKTTRDIAEAGTLEDGLRAALRDVCKLTEWEYAEAWLPTGDGGIRRADIDYYEDGLEEFAAYSKGYTFGENEGLPGRVWTSGEYEWASNLEAGSSEEYPRIERALDVGMQSSLGIPIVADDDVVAVLMFIMSEPREVDERLVETVSSVTPELGNLVVRRQVEQQMSRERDLIDRILEASPIGIQVLDGSGEITRMNERAKEILGIPEEQVDSYSPSERRIYDESGNDVSPADHPFARALDTGEPVFDWQARVEIPEEGHRWLSVNAAPVLDASGSVERVVTTGEDITQLKEQAERLERQRDELQSELEEMFERISDGFYALDESLSFTFVNDRARSLLGIEESDVIGKDLREVVDLSEEFESALFESLEQREPVSLERYYESPDAWFESAIYPSESGLSVYFRDVTERKERERELQEFEQIIKAVNDGIYVIGEDGYYRFVNEELASMFGISKAEMEGAHAAEFLSDHAVEVGREVDKELRSGNSEAVTTDIEVTDVDGNSFYTETTFALLPEGSGRVGVVRDVTERNERERQLRDRIRQQETVTDLGQRALEDPDPDRLMAEAAERVAETLNNEYAKVLELDSEAEQLLLRQGTGWDDGIAGSATVSAVADSSQAAYTLDSKEPVVVEDLSTESRFSGPELLTSHDVKSGISTIIGPPDNPWGILGTHDTDRKEFSEHNANFVQSVANILSTAIDRHRNEQELIRQRQEAAALNHLHEVVADITEAVIEQSTREEIESIVCNRLAGMDSYEFAWIGDLDATTQMVTLRSEAGVEGYLDDNPISVLPEEAQGQGPTGRAFRTGDMQTSDDIYEDPEYEPWREVAAEYGFRSSAAIPITHEDTIYSVLNVYADRPAAFEGQEASVIARLGEIIGHAIAAAQRKHALMSDEIVEVEFHVPNLFDTLGLDIRNDGRITLDKAVPVGDGRQLIYGTVTPEHIDAVELITDQVPYWDDLRLRDDGDGPAEFELRVSDPPILSTVASMGGSVDQAVIEDGHCYFTIHLSPTADLRRLTSVVKDSYPGAEMVTRRQIDRPADTPERVHREIEEALTDRQETVLQAAYHAGFFEWPRDAAGEEIAESLGIASPTFSQHLRKAERKVLSVLLETPVTS